MKPSSGNQKILTIPNLLSFFRLGLIPVFMWAYIGRRDPLLTAGLMILSGATDVADGYIARHYHMVSDFGKALDPIADKLTQLAMLSCLILRFPHMVVPTVLLVIKELTTGVATLFAIRCSGVVEGADWHGKVTTALLYTMMVLHLLWSEIPARVSDAMIIVCVGFMLLSFVLYMIRSCRTFRKNG